MDFQYGNHNVHLLTATYQELVNAFGDGTIDPRDDYKQMAQWNVQTSEGLVDLYDYKVGKCYDPADGLDLENITEWHVQGKKEAIEEMLQMLGDAN